MNLLPRWMRPQAMRRDGLRPEPDPGDMGTAFGLDASLGPLEHEPALLPAAGPAEASWYERLDRRPRR